MSDRLSSPGCEDASRELDGVRLMLGVHESIRRLVNQRMLTSLGIPFSQGSALAHLARGDTVSCQALAGWLGCGTSRLSRLVQDLESRALVVRGRHGGDRRELALSLTPAGLAVAERIPAVLAQAGHAVLDRLSAHERAFLKQFLYRIVEEIDRKPG
ncbi:MarR family winged helix-turn-helix transcriptional regulator [Burkholderia ubonensis]|uniref:MarR family transcriptional regulator n=1 Tax=Burkholderia ubonensis TaxID=101571 RepID=A0A107EGL3_9BURK|nr:MarR family winged helix-turn-helix transcriptional regulator [Burkholderia ubonensis]KWD74778.1 MarR family transcriptional regulator [Burkholderia ubonensis]KWD91518.1 MarR family transcriptional regulator [Burkholderia ubonensis]KWD93752.1 MarR family transcriptional regulator [Burkholderia ubonensis]KWE00440.1 MarR family transcriptional regulator [Burkholderia ubonensis]